MRYLCGLDLGQSQDYTALVVAEQQNTPPQPSYHLRHLERFPLGTTYPDIVSQVQRRFLQLPRQVERHLMVDGTGVGRAVVDLFTRALLHPEAVTITGGDKVTQDGQYWRVPKREMIGTLAVLLQTERLKVAHALPLAPTLVQELLNFRVTIDPRTAHDGYSAWREGQHDDLVLACALAVWWGERPQRLAGTW